jgi:DNA-binding response OmpR family regulator
MNFMMHVGKGRRILVAEDNPALGAMVKYSLEQVGFDTTLVRNGAEAWEKLQSESYELLVTDHQMPELTGCELCERLQQDARFVSLPIIMLSSKGLELAPEMLERIGVRYVVPKPFSPRELIGRIENHLSAVSVN